MLLFVSSVSASLIAMAILLARCASVRVCLLVLAGLSVSLLFQVLWWVSNQFTGEGINEAVIFHINAGAAGLTWELMTPWILLGGIVAFVGVGIVILALRLTKNDPVLLVDPISVPSLLRDC